MKNIAIIPARSGSKGIKDKNIRIVGGKPLMAYTIKAALESGVFDTVMVSTDSQQYAEIAKKYGAEVPFLRSKETSTDTSSSWSVVGEVIKRYEEIGQSFDNLVLLQPTSPLCEGTDIIKAFEIMKEKDANAVISVCELRTPIDICNELPEDLSMVGFYDDKKYRPRQVKKIYYHLNGAIYLYKVDAFKKQKTIYDEKCYALIMDKIKSFDIDDFEDLAMVEIALSFLKGKEKDLDSYFPIAK